MRIYYAASEAEVLSRDQKRTLDAFDTFTVDRLPRSPGTEIEKWVAKVRTHLAQNVMITLDTGGWITDVEVQIDSL